MKSKYKAYQSYKDSGKGWIGEIPSEWYASKLKYSTSIYNGNSISDNQKSDYENQHEGISIPYISTKDLNAKYFTIEYDNGLRIPNESKSNFKVAKKSSTLVCIEGGSAGKKLAYLDRDVCFVNKLACIKSQKNQDSKYLNYFIHSSLFKYSFELATTGLIPGVSISELKDIPSLLPPLQEQQTIANYLDKATAKIDTLIEKQTKLIELLKEKRQAVISTAVTQGLDSSVPMKDSGVEWLGEIPEGWTISKLRFIFSFGKGLTITKANLVDKGIPCVNYGEIHSKYGFEVSSEKHTLKCVDESYLSTSKSSLLSKGDFVFADTSEDIEGAGNFTHMSGDTPIFAGYHTIIARQIDKHSYRFLAYVIDSEAFRTQIRLAVKGVKVLSITQFILRSSIVWLPTLEEQQEIASYLDQKTLKIDNLITKATKAIDLLKERRTALISAVVTGKIDVREAV